MKRINFYTLKQVKEKGGLYDLRTKVIRSPEDAYRAQKELLDLESEAIEHFVIFTLTSKNEIAGVHTLHKGELSSSIVSTRLIFQTALLNNARSVLCFHNHPSGDPAPSREDIDITKKIVEAGKLLQVDILDHIVVGDNNRWVSLKEKGCF